ncbi:MAG: sulfatase [Fimbriimonadaceae bacterium]|nr:sulfatase [Fimbriimonadaceae bacterium]
MGEPRRTSPGPSRRQLLLGAAAACLARLGGAAPGARRPNVLLILGDDHGPQLGCYGTRGLATPHLDALAAAGTSFGHACCAFPSCSPSRTSILTGLYPHAHGTTSNVHEALTPQPPESWTPAQRAHNAAFSVPPEVPTLPELLRQQGYHTAVAQKFHLAPHCKYPFETWPPGNGAAQVEQVVREAGARPFFLDLNIPAPHRPFGLHINRAGRPIVDPAGGDLPSFLPDTPIVRRDWAEYLTAVRACDDGVGAVLAALQRSGRSDETLVIYAGDNGPAWQRGKYTEYAGGLRVPLIVAGPGVQAGAWQTAPVSLTDLFPTVLDYTATALPRPVHGRSLRPLLEGRPGASGHDLVVGEVHFGRGAAAYQGRGATDGRYHYIRRANPTAPHLLPADGRDAQPWGNLAYRATLDAREEFPEAYRLLRQWETAAPAEELFDLAADPWCVHDLSGDPAHREALARLRQLFAAWLEETDDSAFRAAAARP